MICLHVNSEQKQSKKASGGSKRKRGNGSGGGEEGQGQAQGLPDKPFSPIKGGEVSDAMSVLNKQAKLTTVGSDATAANKAEIQQLADSAVVKVRCMHTCIHVHSVTRRSTLIVNCYLCINV